VTLNGFSFGDFHQHRVKDQVYSPDWTQRSRYDYTLNLIYILQALLPEGGEGSISTVPISYSIWHTLQEQKQEVMHKSAEQLLELVEVVNQIYQQTGKLIHINLEPEPDCLLETIDGIIEFFQVYLMGAKEVIAKRHIRVCYDVCHAAVKFTDHARAFQLLQQNGIKIGKVQISSAIKIDFTQITPECQYTELLSLSNSKYLHQVVMQNEHNQIRNYPDLVHALAFYGSLAVKEWRIHYHVPIYAEQFLSMQTTQIDIIAVINLLMHYQQTPHLEIETYTWSECTSNSDLTPYIVREYQWLLSYIPALDVNFKEVDLCKK